MTSSAFRPFTEDHAALGLHDLAAEYALLTAVAADPTGKTYWEVANVVIDQSFHAPAHQEHWRAMGAAIDAGQPLMPPLPAPASEESSSSSDASAATGADPVATARHLVELHQKRLMIVFGDSFWRDLMTPGTAASELMAKAEQGLNRVRTECSAQQARRLVSVGDLFEAGILQAEEAWKVRQENPDGVIGVPTSIRDLDRLLGGFQAGAVHVLAAVPGLGKSTFTRQITANAVKHGYAAFVVSFEEDVTRLAFRYLCSNSEPSMSSKNLLEGHDSPAELRDAALHVRTKLRHLYLTQGTSETTTAELKGKLRVILANPEVKGAILLIDYLQEWAKRTLRGTDLRVVNSQLFSAIRDIALEMKVPALVISSLNRQGYEAPTMASLKEAGDIEFGADTITFMIEQDDMIPEHGGRVIKLSVQKNRFGERSDLYVEFLPEDGHFVPHHGS